MRRIGLQMETLSQVGKLTLMMLLQNEFMHLLIEYPSYREQQQ